MDDDWEVLHFGGLSRNGTGDYDSDGLTDLEEYQHDFNPTVDDGFEDADGDRYPNIFEVRRGSDPNDDESLPSANYVVNAAGGGDYTTISGAVNAATTTNGMYQILRVEAGTYSGTANCTLSISASKPRLLILGAVGAAQTVVDCHLQSSGWSLYRGAVLASLTLTRFSSYALYVSTPEPLRFVDLVVRENATSYGAIYATSSPKLRVVGSTFVENTGQSYAHAFFLSSSELHLENTVVWRSGGGTAAYLGASALTGNHSLVHGATLAGTSNLAGSTDPKLRFDGRLRLDSPLREAGGTVAQSRLDLDLESRPATDPDIGADQFVDSDEDDLADWWELTYSMNLGVLTGVSQDFDEDGLTNAEEYTLGTDPSNDDTDGDGIPDGDEVNTHGTSPLSVDTDGDDMPDGWEVANELDPLENDAFEDADGDRYPNVFEHAKSTDPKDADSIPTADAIVNGAGSGDFTTISAAVTAANTTNGMYQILRVEAGTYSGSANCTLSISASKPRLLILGAAGAAQTVVDCHLQSSGWSLYRGAVLASLTLTRFSSYVLSVYTPDSVQLMDLVVQENSTSFGVIYATNSTKLRVAASTFIENTGQSYAHAFFLSSSQLHLDNTVVWRSAGGTAAYLASSTLTGNHSLVHGITLSGTGNLSGTTDPKLRFDGHLLPDSPLRESGAVVSHSRLDLDLEARPATSPDIGADQYVDSDADGLADWWELAYAGNLDTLTGLSHDFDADGLSNAEEYRLGAHPTNDDTDGDGVLDGDELNMHGTNPLSPDTDGDQMPDGWEIANQLDPLVDDAFDDDDGDRYPNVFEYAKSSDPQNAESTPQADVSVNGAGGGDFTTISAAVTAASTTQGMYQIIRVEEGTYSGSANCSLSVHASKPRLLILGAAGAARTVVDCRMQSSGWILYKGAVLASLTLTRLSNYVLYVYTPEDVRLVDLVLRDNSTAYGAIYASGSPKLRIVGTTLLNNTGPSYAHAFFLSSSQLHLENTVVWRTGGGTAAYLGSSMLSGNHSLVHGITLSGTGNLAGNTDPLLRFDGRPLPLSPLRGAGASVSQSMLDMDLEARAEPNPDIGAGQLNDSDEDGLPDGWERYISGGLELLAGGDFDEDGLEDLGEYETFNGQRSCDPFDPDTDNDWIRDGDEILGGTDPLTHDLDDLASDLNADGVLDTLNLQLGFALGVEDQDGDGLTNAEELLMGTDPLSVDSDGDDIADGDDPFPHDPWINAFPVMPNDVVAPLITLITPVDAALLSE